MPENSIRVRLPALPDPQIFRDPDHTITTEDREALLSYDPQTRSGFIYSIAQRRWTITAPVDFDLFASLVAMAGYRLTASDDTRRWIATCQGTTAPVDLH